MIQTLLYCFMQPARARVLYGYFDDGKLKVLATKTQDFNVPNYVEMMSSLKVTFLPLPKMKRADRMTLGMILLKRGSRVIYLTTFSTVEGLFPRL